MTEQQCGTEAIRTDDGTRVLTQAEAQRAAEVALAYFSAHGITPPTTVLGPEQEQR